MNTLTLRLAEGKCPPDVVVTRGEPWRWQCRDQGSAVPLHRHPQTEHLLQLISGADAAKFVRPEQNSVFFTKKRKHWEKLNYLQELHSH